MVCLVCKNPDGPCRPKIRDFAFFMVQVPTDFEDSMPIPCYARAKVNMLTQGINHVDVKLINGVGYRFKLEKLPTMTCIHGQGWTFFQNDFSLKPGDLILFEFSHDGVSPMNIVAYDEKRIVKKYQAMDDTSSGSSEEEDILEKVYNKHNVVVITRKLVLTEENIANWEAIIDKRGKGIGPLFVHKLTDTNVDNSQLKIPQRIVKALHLDFHGVAILRADEMEDVEGTFSPCSDGRMSIDLDSWHSVVTEKGFSKGQVLVFLFHRQGDLLAYQSKVVITVDVI